jgi:hypothetical protein
MIRVLPNELTSLRKRASAIIDNARLRVILPLSRSSISHDPSPAARKGKSGTDVANRRSERSHENVYLMR